MAASKKNTNKTKPSKKNVPRYLQSLPEAVRADALLLDELFTKITGEKAVLWGDRIVGYGTYHYKSESGREGDWMRTGFAVGKQNFTVYIIPGFAEYTGLLAKLGKHKTSVSCLYFKRLSDLDPKVLTRLIKEGFRTMRRNYPISN